MILTRKNIFFWKIAAYFHLKINLHWYPMLHRVLSDKEILETYEDCEHTDWLDDEIYYGQ